MPEAASSPLILPWLQDVTRAAQHLTRLWVAAEAEAALITRGASLWAFAGRLPRADVQALTEAIVHYWWQGERARHKGEQSAGDWVRFVRLPESQKEYLLYATSLGEEMGLALVFDSATPLSRIRTQTGNLRRALAEPPSMDEVAAEVQPQAQPEAPEFEAAAGDLPAAEPGEAEELPLAPLFSADLVPPPTPEDPAPGNGRLAGARSFLAELFASVEREGQARVVVGPTQDSSPKEPGGGPDEMIPIAESTGPGAAETHRPGTTEGIELSYTCALTPRFPQHQLNGRPAERLKEWLPQLCQAFGWRLERVTIHADYLMWVCRLSAEVAPGFMVKTLRLQTSQRLFFEFPQLAQENASGDFWAPSSLLQTTPVMANALQAFVAAARG